jgi:hypothetical protein
MRLERATPLLSAMALALLPTSLRADPAPNLPAPNLPASNLPAPQIDEVWAPNFETGSGTLPGAMLDGSVDDPDAGVVFIRGTSLELAPMVYSLGGQPGSVLETRRQNGTTTLKLRFPKCNGRAPLIALRTTDQKSGVSSPVWCRGYAVTEATDLATPLQALAFDGVIGDLKAKLVMTYTGQDNEPIAATMDGPSIDRAGLVLAVKDIRMIPSALRIQIVPRGGQKFALRLSLPFETEGSEVEGVFSESVQGYVCGAHRVAQSQCSSRDVGCFARSLGMSVGSLAACSEANAWSGQAWNGPGIAVSLDFIDPVLVLEVGLRPAPAAAGSGWSSSSPPFEADGLSALFSIGGMSLNAPNALLSKDVVRGFVIDEINRVIAQALRSTPRADALDVTIAALFDKLVLADSLQGQSVSTWEPKPDRVVVWYRW